MKRPRWQALALVFAACSTVNGGILDEPPRGPALASFDLSHRLVSPVAPDPDWHSRGDVQVFGPAPNLTAAFTPDLSAAELKLPSGLTSDADASAWTYEISVSSSSGDQSRVTVQRSLCALAPPAYGPPLLTDFLLLHLRPSSDGVELVGIGWDQSRPCVGDETPVRLEGLARSLSRVARWKTSVVAHPVLSVSAPRLPLPPSSQAQALNPDGTPRPPPPPEKGFLAKYWMYLLPAAMMILIGGGEDPKAKAGAGPARKA